MPPAYTVHVTGIRCRVEGAENGFALLDRSVREQQEPKKEQPDTGIASNEPKHGHAFACLMRSPRSDLFTSTMTAESTECGGQKKSNEPPQNYVVF